MGAGGAPHAMLAALHEGHAAVAARRRPVDRRRGGLDRDHLARLRA
jgi:hypothetical protein